MKIKIQWKSFFQRGIRKKPNEYEYTNILISGFQGSGKTYYAIDYVYRNFKNRHIYTNIQSLNNKIFNVTYFTKINDIIYNQEENCVFIIDEISAKYTKESKTDQSFYRWLQQSRKRKRIVLLITQEFKEVPTWLRRPVQYIFMTGKFPFTPFFITYKCDAQHMTLDENMEWCAPRLYCIVYKRTRFISSLYDTYEPITDL